MPDHDVPINPLVEKLAAAGAGGVTRVAGYPGRAPDASLVRVHPSLSDLGQFLDFARADLVAAELDPRLPDGGYSFWLRADANITVGRSTTTQAAYLQGGIATGNLRAGAPPTVLAAITPTIVLTIGLATLISEFACESHLSCPTDECPSRYCPPSAEPLCTPRCTPINCQNITLKCDATDDWLCTKYCQQWCEYRTFRETRKPG